MSTVGITDEKVFGQGLLPDIRARCGHYKWTLQQDGTSCQRLSQLNPGNLAVWQALSENCLSLFTTEVSSLYKIDKMQLPHVW